MPSAETQPRMTSELATILQELSNQNSRLASNLSSLESIGHRAKNTESSNKPEQDTSHKPDGLIQEIQIQLSYTQSHNNKFEELLTKFNSII